MNNRLRNKNEPSPVITIDDIAEKLGISKTTVSRALSGKGRIAKRLALGCWHVLKSAGTGRII